jgi:RimJ/RimL family protein N-acetyltransferase
MEPVTIETERSRAAPFAAADVEAVYAACQDPDIQYYTPVAKPFRQEDAEKFVGETAPEGWASDYDYLLGAFRADEGALVGSFCLTKRAPSGQPHDWWVGGLLSSGPA